MTEVVEYAQLPTSGRHIVETEHSDYIIDMDAKTFERWPAVEQATRFANDNTVIPFDDIVCRTGAPMSIAYRVLPTCHRRTTPVTSIVAAP